jgi:excisionase family DNA binding protein
MQLPFTLKERAMQTIDDELLVDSQRASQILSIPVRTLFLLRSEGRIPYLQIGRAVRYDMQDLKRWIEANKTTAGESQAA